MQANKGVKVTESHSLRNKLLLLIALSVFITEILIFIPSLSSMRTYWVSRNFKETENLSIFIFKKENADLAQKALNNINALSITLIKNGERQELTNGKHPNHINQIIDIAMFNENKAIIETFRALISGKESIIKIVGPTRQPDEKMEVIITNKNLNKILLNFTWYFFLISITISIIATTLIFTVVKWILVYPLHELCMNLIDFALEPDNPNRIIIPEQRKDEIGITQQRIHTIQTELQQNYLRQKHLANLGLAVSKINHDMRNILASVQLISDRLADVKDPIVQKIAPKLIRAIDRAIQYSQSVVTYGNAKEVPPERTTLKLHALVDEVYESLVLKGSDKIEFKNFVPKNLTVDADPNQLDRVISNLVRNSMQAMLGSDPEEFIVSRTSIKAGRIGTTTIIDIEDTGPGLPDKAKKYLFAPFQGSVRNGGTGLGLAICDELIRAHGGRISLIEDGKMGTHFEIRIPDVPTPLTQWQKELKQA